MNAAAIEQFPSTPSTPGAEAVRAANLVSIRRQYETGELPSPAEENPMPADRPYVRLDGDDIELLVSEMRAATEEVAGATARKTVETLMTEENARRFFKVGANVAIEEFKLHAGGLLLDGLKAAATRLFWVAVFVGAVMWFGGLPMLKSMLTAVMPKP
jgi:hypothetical protein